jgi:eukaryotic-like serine/threonine-protein kinase
MSSSNPSNPSKSSDEFESGEFISTLALAHTVENERLAPRPQLELPNIVPLADPYLDQGEVARGGMGSVRHAWDSVLQRHVAVKIVSPRLASDPTALQRFTEEARITAQLDHPNIVPVHLLAHAPDESPCLAMKLVQGRTLLAHLRSMPSPPWSHATLDEVLGIFLKVCDAVAFAHSKGIVHRDLKPENIMVGSFGQVYVMDWGIAKVLDADAPEATLTPGQAVSSRGPMGTPAYMSPEQALRFEPDINERTDVFLLGAVLYEILTGRPPHQGPNLVALLYRAITATITPAKDAAPERHVPPGLSRIAQRAMARAPADRYASVTEMKRDIEGFLRGDERAPDASYAPGEKVIEEGQEGVAAYVIVSGRCVAYKVRDGERVTLREMGPGDVFGETAVITARPTSATVEALEPLKVKIVTREALAETLGLHTWTGAFVRSLAERFREVDERLRVLELATGRGSMTPPRST